MFRVRFRCRARRQVSSGDFLPKHEDEKAQAPTPCVSFDKRFFGRGGCGEGWVWVENLFYRPRGLPGWEREFFFFFLLHL